MQETFCITLVWFLMANKSYICWSAANPLHMSYRYVYIGHMTQEVSGLKCKKQTPGNPVILSAYGI